MKSLRRRLIESLRLLMSVSLCGTSLLSFFPAILGIALFLIITIVHFVGIQYLFIIQIGSI